MDLKSRWNRRSFLSTLGAATGSLFAPGVAVAEKKLKDEKLGVDGHAIVPITKGLGSTGDVYAELGVTPLVFAHGAGAAGRVSVGTTVFGGMIAATTLNLLFIPVLYVLVRSLVPSRRAMHGMEPAPEPAD